MLELKAEHLQIETNKTHTCVELLRGRDGLPGRDGPQGPAGHPGPSGAKSGGATYSRWGNNGCPTATGTEQVYSGITAGSPWNHVGGGANYLCMPEDPEYTLRYNSNGPSYKALLFGTEYEFPVLGQHEHNVPCAVCHVSTRSAVLMIPGKTTCPPTWTREYYGYLMAEHHGHKRSLYECVDIGMESISGSVGNIQGAKFYHTEVVCNVGLPCPPYNNFKEVNCVMCTK